MSQEQNFHEDLYHSMSLALNLLTLPNILPKTLGFSILEEQLILDSGLIATDLDCEDWESA